MRTLKPGKTKVCAQCHDDFVPDKPMQKVCGPLCAVAFARAEREQKKIKAAVAPYTRKAPTKRRSQRQRLLTVAQEEFNGWVRERDYDEPCISCGRHHDGMWNAGHYRTVGGNPELRFEPSNCHKQCAPCNNHKSGDILNYRRNLLQRIGAVKLVWLEGPHPARHYSEDELRALIHYYRAERRRLKALREHGGRDDTEAQAAQG